MTAGKSRPWRLLAPLAAVLALFAAWSGYWLIAFNIAQQEVAARRTVLAAQGTTIACQDESWGGFQFRFEFACRAPVLDAAIQGHQINLRGAALLIVAQAYDPSRIVALLDGPTLIRPGDGSVFEARHDRAIASFRHTGEACGPFAIEIPALTVPGVVEASRLALHLRCLDGRADIAMNGQDLTLHGTVSGPVKLDAASFVAKTDFPGSGLRPKSSRQKSAPCGVVVKGRAGQPRSKRLAGNLATETNDIDGLLGEASRYHPLSEPDRAALKTLLGLIDGSAADKQAKADFIAKDGELYWGPFKLADLPPLY
jgi:hypothetical protein